MNKKKCFILGPMPINHAEVVAIQESRKKMILKNSVVSSIQNVDGRQTNINSYTYFSRGHKLIKNRTFATQNINYTNPNISNNTRTSNVIRIPYTINCNLFFI